MMQNFFNYKLNDPFKFDSRITDSINTYREKRQFATVQR